MKINIFAHAAGREPRKLCPAGEDALRVFQSRKVIRDEARRDGPRAGRACGYGSANWPQPSELRWNSDLPALFYQHF